MKFPSIFRTSQPMRFDIKPRYYDPVKEEIEQRTSRIKRQLEAEGLLSSNKDLEEAMGHDRYDSSIRGAFTQGSPIRNKASSVLSSTGILRLLIILILVGTMVGYLYFGTEILYIMLYVAVGIAALVLFFKLKGKHKE